MAIGFEHSIANWFFLPYGLALDELGAVSAAGVAWNLVAVSAGNIVGGTLLVAGVYWVAYLRMFQRHPTSLVSPDLVRAPFHRIGPSPTRTAHAGLAPPPL